MRSYEATSKRKVKLAIGSKWVYRCLQILRPYLIFGEDDFLEAGCNKPVCGCTMPITMLSGIAYI